MSRKINYWNNETLRAEAIKYKNRRTFKEAGGGGYCYMMSHKSSLDLDYICSHMKKIVKWEYAPALIESKKYTSMSELRDANCSLCRFIRSDEKLLAEVRLHLKSGGGGFNPKKPASFYLARLNNGLYKYGITNRSFYKRYEKADRDIMTLIYEIRFLDGQDAKDLEKEVSKKSSHLKYKGERVLKGASTWELITAPISLF